MFDRDTYISEPCVIEKELKYLFELGDSLVIFDIGSCEGEDAIKYSNLFSNSTIYAVEPLPSNLPLLSNNIKKYSKKNIHVLPLALSDKKGIAQFYVSSGHPDHISKNVNWDFGNKSSSLLPPDELKKTHPWLEFNEIIEVETDTLLNICNQRDIQVIDFIHLDVQGAELQVLQGLGELLNNTKAIWMEVEAIPLYLNQSLKQDVEMFMKDKGFILVKDTVDKIAGDQLFINGDKYITFKLRQLLFNLINILRLKK